MASVVVATTVITMTIIVGALAFALVVAPVVVAPLAMVCGALFASWVAMTVVMAATAVFVTAMTPAIVLAGVIAPIVMRTLIATPVIDVHRLPVGAVTAIGARVVDVPVTAAGAGRDTAAERDAEQQA
ncbi:hypothetical protein GCM10028792_36590 [Salinisphaera aquimarina]